MLNHTAALRFSRMPCLNAKSTGRLFCVLCCTDGLSHVLLISDVMMLTVPLVHVNIARSVYCNFSSITTMMVTHFLFLFPHSLSPCSACWYVSVCLKLFTFCSSASFSLNLSANFQPGLTCECV